MKQFYEEKNNLTPSFLRIKCPYCLQVFKAFRSEFEEEQPDFQCASCQEIFWISATDSSPIVLGQPVSTQKNSQTTALRQEEGGIGISTKICPRCAEEAPINDQECPHCGVVFIKMIEGAGASFQLRGEWAKVVKNWHDDNSHDSFLRSCHKQNELVYGVSCYGRVLKEDKNNRKAKEMIKRMESLTWFFEEQLSLPKLPIKQALYSQIKKGVTSYAFDAFLLALILCFAVYIFF